MILVIYDFKLHSLLQVDNRHLSVELKPAACIDELMDGVHSNRFT